MTVITDTIAAIATPAGRGGIGVIRVSGPLASSIGKHIIQRQDLPPRQALLCRFHNAASEPQLIDQGIALFFNQPASFTGEDVLELQGHGSPVVLDMLLETACQLGARIANPGEFSERAFINNKLDLAQAEAIADLIDSGSQQAARSAMRSLIGEFSKRIDSLTNDLIQLRIYVEAAIDFPEEEIDFLSDSRVTEKLNKLQKDGLDLRKVASRGQLLKDGMTIAIAGRPNAGKSSLLNCLAGTDSAIVTPHAGTTRDVLREHIHIDGLPLHIIDTAGLRNSDDPVEQEGIRRAVIAINKADRILVMVDSREPEALATLQAQLLKPFGVQADIPVTVILNKTDLLEKPAALDNSDGVPKLALSAKTGDGVDGLREHLKSCMGFTESNEQQFIARRRHLHALDKALAAIDTGARQLIEQQAGELLAEELRMAQLALGEITGEVSSDELLGAIFSSFCIGK